MVAFRRSRIMKANLTIEKGHLDLAGRIAEKAAHYEAALSTKQSSTPNSEDIETVYSKLSADYNLLRIALVRSDHRKGTVL